MSLSETVAEARKEFKTGKTKFYAWRRKQLFQLLRFINENTEAIYDALYKDLHKNRTESENMEVTQVRNEIGALIRLLSKITKPYYPQKSRLSILNTTCYTYEPLGVCLIGSAFNYPVMLLLQPLAGAIAAGNCVIIKPSEHAAHTAKLFKALLPQYIDPVCYPVVICDAKQSADLVNNNRFDHITYTGSTKVAKLIMKAASEHLTPVLLELGGKNPCFVHKSADLQSTARKLVHGKFTNAGQICVAIDYVLCDPEIQDELIKHLQLCITEFFGENPQKSDFYGRIINQTHFRRIKSLLGEGKIVIGGEFDEADRYIAPTVVTDVPLDSSLMEDEIFGPILPILPLESVEKGIEFVNKFENSLQSFVFATNRAVIDQVNSQTYGAGIHVNDTLLQNNEINCPFGGRGYSGMGKYHGMYSIDAYSHTKTYYEDKTPGFITNLCRYPPYNGFKDRMLRLLILDIPPMESISEDAVWFMKLAVFGIIIAIIAKAKFFIPTSQRRKLANGFFKSMFRLARWWYGEGYGTWFNTMNLPKL